MKTESVHRVAVTGIGVVGGLGMGIDALWTRLMAGESTLAPIAGIDTAGLKTRVGSEVQNAALAAAMKDANLPPSDRCIDMALLAAGQALRQSGLPLPAPEAPPLDAAVLFGASIGVGHTMFESCRSFASRGVRGIRPTTVPRAMPNAISARVSMHYRLGGANYVVSCACSSSTAVLGIAFRAIRHGYSARVLCGGTDAPFEPFVYSAWNNLGVLSREPDPARACRPFDRDRDGFVLGEGAGAVLLESLEAARERGAPILAEVLGYGESSDADHVTRPNPAGQERAIRQALATAGIAPEEIGFINAHGTATKVSDPCEALSLRRALGPALDRIPVVSYKSYQGHLLGASGVVEFAMTVEALRRGYVPANLKLDNPDPECDLCFVRGSPIPLAAPVALKNCFGFGGNNTVLVLRRYEDAQR